MYRCMYICIKNYLHNISIYIYIHSVQYKHMEYIYIYIYKTQQCTYIIFAPMPLRKYWHHIHYNGTQCYDIMFTLHTKAPRGIYRSGFLFVLIIDLLSIRQFIREYIGLDCFFFLIVYSLSIRQVIREYIGKKNRNPNQLFGLDTQHF